MMRYDQQIEEMSKQLLEKTGGMFMVMPCVPTALFPVVPMSLWHYWGLSKGIQREMQRANLIRGRAGVFVFQSSHGRQQIKPYKPWIYKNEVNTPLRIRARRIMQLASQEPKEERKEKVRELYRTYPYHLLKAEPVNLRMKNFYFDRPVMKGDLVKILRAVDPGNPDPGSDVLYCQKEYGEKKTVKFEYEDVEEQHYYAVNTRNKTMSNALHFMWQEDIEFEPTVEKQPNKWAEAAKVFHSDEGYEMQPQIFVKRSRHTEAVFKAREKAAEVGSEKGLRSVDFRKYIERLMHFYYYYERMRGKHERLIEQGFYGKKVSRR